MGGVWKQAKVRLNTSDEEFLGFLERWLLRYSPSRVTWQEGHSRFYLQLPALKPVELPTEPDPTRLWTELHFAAAEVYQEWGGAGMVEKSRAVPVLAFQVVPLTSTRSELTIILHRRPEGHLEKYIAGLLGEIVAGWPEAVTLISLLEDKPALQARREAVIRQRYEAGETDEEIADKLGLSPEYVKELRLGMGLKRRRGR